MWMVILLWVTMATPPWLSTAWGLWVGLAGAGTHAPVNTGAHTHRLMRISEIAQACTVLVWCLYVANSASEPREKARISASLTYIWLFH